MTVPEQHQLKIARASMKMHCTGIRIMGGPDHVESAFIIARLTGKFTKLDPDCTCVSRNTLQPFPRTGI